VVDLPRYFAKPELPSLQLPRTTPEQYGAGVFGALAQAAEALNKQELPIEAAKLKAEYDVGLDSIRQGLGTENPDPTTWDATLKQKESELKNSILAKSTNPDVLKHVQEHMAGKFGVYQIQVNHDSLKARAQDSLGTLDVLEAKAIRDIGLADDPAERERIINETKGLIRSQAVSGPASLFNSRQAADREMAFDKKAAVAQIDRLISKTPNEAVLLINSGKYNDVLDQQTLLNLQIRAEGRASVAQNAADKAEKKQMEDNRDNLIREAVAGENPVMVRDRVNQAFMGRQISKEGRDEALKEIDGLITSGGVVASDRRVYEDLEYRARFGGVTRNVTLPTPDEIRTAAANGKLSRPDKDHLDAILAEAMKRTTDDNDVSKDPHYKRGMAAIRQTLPSSDRLDLDQATRMIVGNAQSEFDRAMRDPKYGPGKADQVAQSIIDTALARMGKSDVGLRSKLLPGIQTPQDVGTAVRAGRMGNNQALEQLRIIQELQNLQKTRPQRPGSTNRDEAARQFMQGQP